FVSQYGCAIGRSDVAIGILEVAEWPIDRPQTVGPASHQHAGLRRVPGICPEVLARTVGVLVREYSGVFVDTADHGGSGASGRRVVRHTEAHGLQSTRWLRDGFHVGHAESGFDQHGEADALVALLRRLDLGHEHVHGIHVRSHADFGDEYHVESRAGFHDVDDVP